MSVGHAHPGAAAEASGATTGGTAPPCFIETQFPVSRLSKESYRERKANKRQTLTGLGKWWGRKPLVMVRATILGLLLPASKDRRKDRDVFLALLTMDDDGLRRRRERSIPLREVWARLSHEEHAVWFAPDTPPERPKLRKGLTGAQKRRLQELAFDRMTYDEKLRRCALPEEVEGPSEAAWKAINAHLGTGAASLPELVRELGERRFGRAPRVGDAFCGGGSVPFEAARLGCDAFGADLNPVAALLTWSAIHIVGGDEAVAERVRTAQQGVFDAVDRQITEWGIEHNDAGWRADAFLYCAEAMCPGCGWLVPLAPSWVIGTGTQTVARLRPDPVTRRFDIVIESGVGQAGLAAARAASTVRASRLICPQCDVATPMTVIRGDRRDAGRQEYGLRLWEKEDLVPRPGDVIQERLYCIRWRPPNPSHTRNSRLNARYREVGPADLEREARVLALLRQRFQSWQARGFLPSRHIEPGYNTTQVIRERGWTYWHHLFTPRQLLMHGQFAATTAAAGLSKEATVACLLGLGRIANWDGRLSMWDSGAGQELVHQSFSNQALNTLDSFGVKGFSAMANPWFIRVPTYPVNKASRVQPADARETQFPADLWITDPPYADAVNYHELSEYFLAWYGGRLQELFPDWYGDSKRVLAVRGTGGDFRRSMVDCYRNLARHMPDDGLQVVMFTHQDASVWADLSLILWAAGLRVTAAWTIGTETTFGMKQGNYVQGTVLIVLRKQTSDETAFLDELVPQVEEEVEHQLDSMLHLDEGDLPNFSDADYQLAAYAAALRVLTRYRAIGDIDISYELARERSAGEESQITRIIAGAVRTASNALVPRGLPSRLWRRLGSEEKFYLKGLEVEGHGEFRAGVYQEFARGFGVRDYAALIRTDKANQTRLQTASEFGKNELGDGGFGRSLVRHALYAVWRAVATESAAESLIWLRTELSDYWNRREALLAVLRYLAAIRIEHWHGDAVAAKLVAGAVENDHV